MGGGRGVGVGSGGFAEMAMLMLMLVLFVVVVLAVVVVVLVAVLVVVPGVLAVLVVGGTGSCIPPSSLMSHSCRNGATRGESIGTGFGLPKKIDAQPGSPPLPRRRSGPP